MEYKVLCGSFIPWVSKVGSSLVAGKAIIIATILIFFSEAHHERCDPKKATQLWFWFCRELEPVLDWFGLEPWFFYATGEPDLIIVLYLFVFVHVRNLMRKYQSETRVSFMCLVLFR